MSDRAFRLAIYFNGFVLGFVLMGFEMLGSRFLNPWFGSGINTWAALISVTLFALTLSDTGIGIPEEAEGDRDALYDQAVAWVTESRRASISSVQRQLRIGGGHRPVKGIQRAGMFRKFPVYQADHLARNFVGRE